MYVRRTGQEPKSNVLIVKIIIIHMVDDCVKTEEKKYILNRYK